jgi:glycosyltransferase involved in cell wall biosynthesis
VERLNHNTFVELRDYTEAGYKTEIERLAEIIEHKLRDFIAEKEIDFLMPQNVWSVAASPPVAIALTRVMRDLQLPTLAHNHDFYWERVDGVALTCKTAIEIADKYLPPRDPLTRHVVINSLGQQQLFEHKGIASTVVPNIFDFNEPPWQPDEYNRDFRAKIGLKESDIFILQATRIVPRKGIELAIDFVKALDTPARRAHLQEHGLADGRAFNDDSRIVLVLAGYAADDLSGRYLPQLKQKVAQIGVEALFIDDLVGGRREMRDGKKIYSLWDTYVYADFVTYPSLWEGWGNQLLEAVRAQLPLMLFEYPVYQADIKDKGFRFVSLGSECLGQDDLGLVQVAPDIVDKAADQALSLLTDAQLRRETVEHNLKVGQQYYSMEALRDYLFQLMKEFD